MKTDIILSVQKSNQLAIQALLNICTYRAKHDEQVSLEENSKKAGDHVSVEKDKPD